MPRYDLRITVTEVRGGPCEFGLKPGDVFEFHEDKVDFCSWAHSAMFPFISAMRYGASLPWEPDSRVAYVACPDPHNTVVFKIERVGECKE